MGGRQTETERVLSVIVFVSFCHLKLWLKINQLQKYFLFFSAHLHVSPSIYIYIYIQ